VNFFPKDPRSRVTKMRRLSFGEALPRDLFNDPASPVDPLPRIPQLSGYPTKCSWSYRAGTAPSFCDDRQVRHPSPHGLVHHNVFSSPPLLCLIVLLLASYNPGSHLTGRTPRGLFFLRVGSRSRRWETLSPKTPSTLSLRIGTAPKPFFLGW